MPYELLDDVPSEESLLGYAGRTGARTLARAGEAIAGLPGDIISGGIGLAKYGMKKGEELLGPTNYGVNTGLEKHLPNIPLPTSEAIRENVTKPLTGQYLEPQSSGEEFYDQIIGDAAALLVPFKGKVPFKKAIAGALGKSAVGNVAQWAGEEVTGSPLIGTGLKIGSMALAGTFGGRKEMNKLQKDSYTDAYKNLPEGVSANFSPQISKIDKLVKTISRGDRPDKAFLLDRLNSVKSITPTVGKVSGAEPIIGATKKSLITPKAGNLDVREAIKLKSDWNKWLQDPNLKKETRDTLKQAIGIMNDGIERYGNSNPGFYKPFQVGEELTGALKSTNYIQKVLAKHLPSIESKVKNPWIQKLIWSGAGTALGSYVGFPTIAAIGGAGLTARESAKFYQLMTKSPIARQAYKGYIEAALRNDAKAIARNLAKLDKSADDFEDKYGSVENEEPGRYEFVG